MISSIDSKSHPRVAFCLPLYFLALIVFLSSPVTFAADQIKLDIEQEYSPLDKPAPVYPSLAISAFIEGDVIVEYTVKADGGIGNARIIESDSILLDQAALDSAAGYQYIPRKVAGKAVDVPGVRTIIKFRLSDEVLVQKQQQEQMTALLKQKKYDEALVLIGEIKSSSDEIGIHSSLLLLEGRLYRDIGNLPQAIKVFESLRSQSEFEGEQRSVMLGMLAIIYTKEKKYIESIGAYEELLKITVFEDSTFPYRVNMAMAMSAYKIKDYELSKTFVDVADTILFESQIEPYESDFLMRAKLYNKLNEQDAEISQYEKLVAMNPSVRNLQRLQLSHGVTRPLHQLFLSYAQYHCDAHVKGLAATLPMTLMGYGFYAEAEEILRIEIESNQSQSEPSDKYHQLNSQMLEMLQLASQAGYIETRALNEFFNFSTSLDDCNGTYYEALFEAAKKASDDPGIKEINDKLKAASLVYQKKLKERKELDSTELVVSE